MINIYLKEFFKVPNNKTKVLNRQEIFRNTEDFYLKETENLASPALIRFAIERCGKSILDVGCATGDYCLELTKRGFRCTGVDSNVAYVEKAKSKNVEAYVMNASSLDFNDKSFDTILLFEVLEHAENPSAILKEAKRIAKRNILITVPNNTQLEKLSSLGLTFEHMLDENHVNFFTKQSLSELLKKYFTKYTVAEKEPLILTPPFLEKVALTLSNLKIIRPIGYFRLYAEAII